MSGYPTTRQGTIDVIIAQLQKAETTYVVFCKELASPDAKDARIMEHFCNTRCQIHKLHNSHQLLCLPYSCLKLLKEKPV